MITGADVIGTDVNADVNGAEQDEPKEKVKKKRRPRRRWVQEAFREPYGTNNFTGQFMGYYSVPQHHPTHVYVTPLQMTTPPGVGGLPTVPLLPYSAVTAVPPIQTAPPPVVDLMPFQRIQRAPPCQLGAIPMPQPQISPPIPAPISTIPAAIPEQIAAPVPGPVQEATPPVLTKVPQPIMSQPEPEPAAPLVKPKPRRIEVEEILTKLKGLVKPEQWMEMSKLVLRSTEQMSKASASERNPSKVGASSRKVSRDTKKKRMKQKLLKGLRSIAGVELWNHVYRQLQDPAGSWPLEWSVRDDPVFDQDDNAGLEADIETYFNVNSTLKAHSPLLSTRSPPTDP